MTNKIEKYQEYKSSGVEWLGDVPAHWEVLPGFTIVSERNERNFGLKENTVLSLSYGSIVIKPEEKLTGLVPESFETYQLVYPADIIVRPMDLQNDKTSLRIGLSYNKGIISNAYLNLMVRKTNNYKFYYYFFHTIDTTKIIYGLGSGLRQNLSFLDFKTFKFVVPPISEQISIANFLDRKTTLIDQAINIKQKQIDLLKERRQILIHNAVTRGINPSVKMKNSGVEWIGEIPEHWEVKRLKDICQINLDSLPEVMNRNYTFQYVDIGSVTLEQGITQTETFTFKEAPSRARRIAKNGDTIISTVRTYLKAIDFIDEEKCNYIFSTGFAILQPQHFYYPKFLAYFVRSNAFTEQVTVNSKGMSYPAINSTDISRLVVVQTSINEQAEIINYIERFENKISAAISLKEKEIEKLKEYKATLINSAVTGKIKVA